LFGDESLQGLMVCHGEDPGSRPFETSVRVPQRIFVVTALMNIVVVALALFVLKPMRARQMAKG
jgi:hypothetical protein